MKYFPQECILTLDELRVLCDEWKQVLGLRNWEIVLVLAGHGDLDGVQGNCNWTLQSRQAVIKFVEPKHFDNDLFVYDMETVLVHELLHCFFVILDNNPLKSIAGDIHEQNIDLLAHALVGLKREKKIAD